MADITQVEKPEWGEPEKLTRKRFLRVRPTFHGDDECHVVDFQIFQYDTAERGEIVLDIDGSIRFDGCANWHVPECVHTCSQDECVEISVCLTIAYRRAHALMTSPMFEVEES